MIIAAPLESTSRRTGFEWLSTLATIALAFGAFVLAFILTLVLYISVKPVHLSGPWNPGNGLASAASIAAYAAGTLVLIWRLPKLAGRSLEDLGLRPLRRRDAPIVVGAVLCVFILRFIMWPYLVLLHQTHHVQAGFEHLWFRTSIEAAAFLVMGVVCAPIGEELLFRGTFYNALAVRMAPAWAAVGSGFIFGLAHGDLVLLPFLAIIGVVLAVVYRLTKNLYASMIVHATTNALPLLFIVFHGVPIR